MRTKAVRWHLPTNWKSLPQKMQVFWGLRKAKNFLSFAEADPCKRENFGKKNWVFYCWRLGSLLGYRWTTPFGEVADHKSWNYLASQIILYKSSAKYLGVHRDERLTYSDHIRTKRAELGLWFWSLYWFLSAESALSSPSHCLLYVAALCSIRIYTISVGDALKILSKL